MFSLGKRTRGNMDDKANNDKEVESLIPKREKRPLTGVYLDLLSHGTFNKEIWPFLFAHTDVNMEQFFR